MKKLSILAVSGIVTLSLLACGNKTEAAAATGDATVVSRVVSPASVGAMLNTVDKYKLTLVELGSDSCRPCRMMTPVLAALSVEYKDQVQVAFFDVWKNEEAGQYYSIRVIPVQIILDKSGKELFRHEGFFPKEALKAKLESLLKSAG